MLASVISLFFVLSFFLLNKRIGIVSSKPSPLGILLLIAVVVQIVPGIILVSFYAYPMSYGLNNSISEEVLYFTYWYTMLSLAFLFFLLYLVSYVVNFKVDMMQFGSSYKVGMGVYLLSLMLIVVKLISVGELPLVQAILGDHEAAAEQKARILKGEVGAGGFLVGYLFAYFHYVALAYLYIAKKQGVISSLMLYSFFVFAALYSVYDLQKYNFAFLAIFIFSLHFVVYGVKIGRLIFLMLVSGSLLILAFMLLHDSSLNEVVVQIASRTLIGQMEGSYMIYEALVPEITRALYGVPFSFLLGKGTDPAADVVRIFFPDAGDAWVNSNTYILAHAWSIFGFAAAFIMPIILVLNVTLFVIFRDIFKKYIGLGALCIYFTLILTLRINNDFSYFLYGRAMIAFCALGIPFFLILVFLKVKKSPT